MATTHPGPSTPIPGDVIGPTAPPMIQNSPRIPRGNLVKMRSHLYPSMCWAGHILNSVLKPLTAPGNHHSQCLMVVRFFSENITPRLRGVAIQSPTTQPGAATGIVDRDIHPAASGPDLATTQCPRQCYPTGRNP